MMNVTSIVHQFYEYQYLIRSLYMCLCLKQSVSQWVSSGNSNNVSFIATNLGWLTSDLSYKKYKLFQIFSKLHDVCISHGSCCHCWSGHSHQTCCHHQWGGHAQWLLHHTWRNNLWNPSRWNKDRLWKSFPDQHEKLSTSSHSTKEPAIHSW